MRAVAFGVGVAAALVTVSVWAASVWAASLDGADAPVATARYVDPPPSVSATAAASTLAPVPNVVEPDASRPIQSLQSALAEARQDIDAIGDRLSGLMTGVQYRRETAYEVARYSAPTDQAGGILGLRQRLARARTPGQKPRVFLFAGDQGGERRVGIAWQRGRTRFALTGLERKFCQFGAEMKDRVVALSVSFSPGSSDRRDRQPG